MQVKAIQQNQAGQAAAGTSQTKSAASKQKQERNDEE
jgi:hypothetical protein